MRLVGRGRGWVRSRSERTTLKPRGVEMKLVVLISGSGTTLQNLIDRTADGRLAARIVGVVSSKPDVLGVERATKAGLPVAVVERGPGFSDRVFAAVRGFAPDLVILAGWLHLVRIPE